MRRLRVGASHIDVAAMRLGVLASHPIQYHAPVFRELARRCDLAVFFAHRQTPQGQAAAGFGVPFEWDVDVLSGYEHRFLRNVAASPGTTSFAGCDTPGIAEAITSGRFDAFLVTGWNLKSYWQAVRACRHEGIPVMVRGDSQLVTRRGIVKRAAKRIVYPWLLRRFDRCLYVGRRSREYYEHYGVAESKLAFSPHCVDNEYFGARGTAVAGKMWRAAHRIAPDRPVALFAGKLVGGKRPADFLRAMAASGSAPSARPLAVVAGEGELRPMLEALARSQVVDALFVGFRNQSQLPEIYSAADLLCLPSDGETWGLVVNEAMACGTPAVVSDACGCAPDLIDEGRTGHVFATGDVAALADALARTFSLKRSMVARRAIADKLAVYSVPNAAEGILRAAATCAPPVGQRPRA